MYLHLGKDTMINVNNLIGIFDIDTTTVSKRTRDFLAKAEKNGNVINTSMELPKSFAVMSKNNTIYINQLSTSTLKGRIEALPSKKYKNNKK